MKLRIIKKDDKFYPQIFSDKFKKWTGCYNDESFDPCSYNTIEEALVRIEKIKKQHPKPEVVWEEEY